MEIAVWDQDPVEVEVETEIRKQTGEQGVKKVKCWQDGGTQDEEMYNSPFLSAPPTVTRDVWVEMVKNRERRQEDMQQTKLNVAFFLGSWKLVDLSTGDREGTVLEEADAMPVSTCRGKVRVDGNIEDVVEIP
mgnify:CR=1 FL=1